MPQRQEPSSNSLTEVQMQLLAELHETVARVRNQDAQMKVALGELSDMKATLLRAGIGPDHMMW